jgi:hypothetical protein
MPSRTVSGRARDLNLATMMSRRRGGTGAGQMVVVSIGIGGAKKKRLRVSDPSWWG